MASNQVEGNSDTYLKNLRAVSHLMYEEWQPIGFGSFLPKDEYDPYAAEVLAMVRDGSSEEEICSHLIRIESELMATVADFERAQAVARRIFTLLVASDA
jgi:hypothetical protein